MMRKILFASRYLAWLLASRCRRWPRPRVRFPKPSARIPTPTYSTEEILGVGHQFFGKTTRGLAKAVEYVFQSQGEPTAYIVGEEGAGAFVGGLRYGEGTIYYKDGTKQRIYWQGPSVGFDFGANGSRTLVLVYNSSSPATSTTASPALKARPIWSAASA